MNTTRQPDQGEGHSLTQGFRIASGESAALASVASYALVAENAR